MGLNGNNLYKWEKKCINGKGFYVCYWQLLTISKHSIPVSNEVGGVKFISPQP